MVAISASGKLRHPVFREYFEQKVKDGKNKPQALVRGKTACEGNLWYDEDQDGIQTI